MQITKAQAREKIKELVERFGEHVDEYRRNAYNEHETRVDFIDPFFKALGWDVNNELGHPEAFREVIHEDKVKVGSSTKAPDYGFTLFGQRKFFVDAKRPSINIKKDIAPAYQVRRYGWSAKVPLSIVTDFEEFSIYDCTKKPKLTDKASVSRIKYITYDQYLDEFDFLWNMFGRVNLPKGYLDEYAKSDTRKKGTETVDSEFLKSIEQWRLYLARNIALRNLSLSEDEINYAVQKIIDRILFLRMCEDRGVEQYGGLKNAISSGDIRKNLFDLFQTADKKYNSGLFDFIEDKITPSLRLDTRVIKRIVEDLYFPISEYEFSVMPADILGSVYEQFLGKTIRLTKAHQAKVEDKPEVRKAGGVYYTPKYIVDYIVKLTLGKLIEGKLPTQVEKIKLCDPACGSGSFLIGAYQFLIDWHLNYYTVNPPKKKKNYPLTPEGNLTTSEKKKILLNNIYGVDIDPQAVEVTKLNLLLKALEGETQASISQQLTLFHERVLPNLSGNIKCGNSIINADFHDNQLELMPEKIKKIKAFDWQEGFPNVFLNGGFDVLIGNPPYGASLDKDQLNYLRKKYATSNYQMDTYSLFIERTDSILKPKGMVGFIIPSAWVASFYDKELRQFIIKRMTPHQVVITPKKTFKDATVETLILICEKGRRIDKLLHVSRWDVEGEENYDLKINDIFDDKDCVFPVYTNPIKGDILHAIVRNSRKLKEVAELVWGVKIYQKGKGKPPQDGSERIERIYHTDMKTKKTHLPLLGGKNITRYNLQWDSKYVDYGEWLAEPRTLSWFSGERILVREVTAKGQIQATFVKDEYVFSNSIDGLRMIEPSTSIHYILGLLNSKLISFYHFNSSPNAFKGTFPKLLVNDLRELPIPLPNSKIEKQIIKCAENLLNLNNQLIRLSLDDQRQQIKQTIVYNENKIDQLVYELYGLTDSAIEIIEN